MSFLRHGQVYQPERIPAGPARRRPSFSTPPPRAGIRLDEPADGYSLVGCSPAEPASASPSGSIIGHNPLAVNTLRAIPQLSLFFLCQRRGAVQHTVSFSATLSDSTPGHRAT